MKNAIINAIKLLAVALFFGAALPAAAQCALNPTGETAVGLQNSSSHFLTFYIDGRNMGGVPSGDKSVDFNVTAGQHTLRADAQAGDRTLTVSRVADIPEGYVCTWTVVDAEGTAKAADAEKASAGIRMSEAGSPAASPGLTSALAPAKAAGKGAGKVTRPARRRGRARTPARPG